MLYREPARPDYSAAWRRYWRLRDWHAASGMWLLGAALLMLAVTEFASAIALGMAAGCLGASAVCFIKALADFMCPRCGAAFLREQRSGGRFFKLQRNCQACGLHVGE